MYFLGSTRRYNECSLSVSKVHYVRGERCGSMHNGLVSVEDLVSPRIIHSAQA